MTGDGLMGKKKDFGSMQKMIDHRNAMLSHHESKVVQLKKTFEERLAAVEKREASFVVREKELKALASSSDKLRKEKQSLERECESLAREEAVMKSYVAKQSTLVGALHRDEARLVLHAANLEKKVAGLNLNFDNHYKNSEKITSYLRAREAELRRVLREIKEAEAHRALLLSEITHHSVSEIHARLKRAEESLRTGFFDRAAVEYEAMRKFYSNLSRSEKKKLYHSIEQVKSRLSRLAGNAPS